VNLTSEQIQKMLKEGMSDKEIAEKLAISLHTVRALIKFDKRKSSNVSS